MKLSFNWGKKTRSNPLGIFIEECLTKEEAAKIIRLNIGEISLLATGERIKVFSSLIGGKAEWFNSKFESDYILKNQKEGLLNWANKAEMKEKFRKEIVRRISKLENVLDREQEEKFLDELAKLKLGVGTTEEEELTITDLCHKVDDAHSQMENGGSREDYEKAKAALDAYLEELKNY